MCVARWRGGGRDVLQAKGAFFTASCNYEVALEVQQDTHGASEPNRISIALAHAYQMSIHALHLPGYQLNSLALTKLFLALTMLFLALTMLFLALPMCSACIVAFLQAPTIFVLEFFQRQHCMFCNSTILGPNPTFL